MERGVQIEFAYGASWIWHHHDFRVQQDHPQAPLRLEYGNFTTEVLEVEDSEFMVARIFPQGSEYDFQVEVIDSDGVNAVVFPGGKILIYHVLLEKGHPVANVEAPVFTSS